MPHGNHQMIHGLLNVNPDAHEDRDQLLGLLRQFHFILNTAWSKPGVPEMAGAS